LPRRFFLNFRAAGKGLLIEVRVNSNIHHAGHNAGDFVFLFEE